MRLRYLIPLLLLTSPVYAQSNASSCDLPLDEAITVYETQLQSTPFKFVELTVDDGQALEFSKEVYRQQGKLAQDVDFITVIHITNPTTVGDNNMVLFSYKGCVVDQIPASDKLIKATIDAMHKNGA